MYLNFKRASIALCLGLTSVTALAQNIVRGSVKDANGEPMIGVTINMDGKAAAITDIDGNFAIPNAKSSSQIKISYVGYKEQTVTVGNQSRINIVLAEDNELLDEVVVVGYGTMKKSDLTGAISSVHSEDIVAKGSSSVLGAMQGAVAGVNITQSSSRAGGSMNIEIRGKSSINSDVTPLFIVDGVICDNIDFLNEQDIEKMDILKDASSTAIYGSRASAGVVQITTKGGLGISKGTKSSISYDGYYGVAVVSRMPEFQNAKQFYDYRFVKFLTYGGGVATPQSGTPNYQMTQASYNQGMLQAVQGDYTSPSVLKNMLASGVSVDWPDLVTQNGRQQNHYISASGSSEKISYNMGLGYNNVEGVYKGDETSKVSFKGSLDATINKYVNAGFNLNIAKIDHDYSSDQGVQEAYRMNPFMKAYNDEGELIINPGANAALGTNGNQFTSSYNPLIYFQDSKKNRETWHLLGNIYLQVNPLKGLNFKTTFSPSYSYYRQGEWSGTQTGETSASEAITKRSFDYTWDNILTYDNTFKEIHHLNLMGLFSAQHNDNEGLSMAYNNIYEGTYWWAMQNATNGLEDVTTASGVSFTEDNMISWAFRANYSLMDRYMLTATIRWDGSSRFADGHRWGCFPSASAAWRLSEEDFIKKNTPWISNLKLRVSYGITGNNRGISSYAYMQSIASNGQYPFGTTGSTKSYTAMYPNGIVDANLKWESSKEFNIGLDYGFLDNRINGTIDWYHKKSYDLLYEMQLPLEAGLDGSSPLSMTTNIGSVMNTGVEFSVNGVIIKSKELNWTVSANWSHNTNRVKEIDGTGNNLISGNSSGNLFINGPVNNVYGYQWDGIVTDKTMTVPNTDVAVKKGFVPGSTVKESDYYYACYGWTEGSPIVKDIDGDGTFTNSDKRVYRADPAWTASFSTNVTFKGFDLAASFYTKQHYNVYSNFYERYYDLTDRGRMRLNMDYYIPAGTLIDCDGVNDDGTYINPVYQQTTHYGSLPFPNNGGTNGGTNNSYWGGSNGAGNFQNVSYVKLQNVTLGYTLPRKLTSKFGCQKLRVYINVTNPIVWTNYKGFDPEWAGASLKNDGPSTTTWQFGANIKF